MGQTKTSALKEVRAFKKILSKKMKIEQMILYGSRARGDYLKQSDVDVIVVSDAYASVPFFERK